MVYRIQNSFTLSADHRQLWTEVSSYLRDSVVGYLIGVLAHLVDPPLHVLGGPGQHVSYQLLLVQPRQGRSELDGRGRGGQRLQPRHRGQGGGGGRGHAHPGAGLGAVNTGPRPGVWTLAGGHRQPNLSRYRH